MVVTAHIDLFRDAGSAPRRLRELRMAKFRRGFRLGLVFLSVVLAGIFAETGGASDVVAVDDGSATAELTGGLSSDGTVVETTPTDGSEVPSTEEPAPAETPPSDTVVEPPPAETPPADTVVEPPPAETPPSDTVVEPPPAETPPSDIVEEPPPVESPLPPQLPEDPSNTSGRLDDDRGAMPAPGLAPPEVPALSGPVGSAALFAAGGSAESAAGGGSPSRGDPSSRPLKADNSGLGGLAPRSPLTSSAPSASGVAPPSAGAGFGIAAEFIVPLLLMLSSACALFLKLPHATAYALRSERPG